MNKMHELYMCLCNDIRGVNVIEDADLEGYKLVDVDTGETLYTAYVTQQGAFSSYVAVNDFDKGIECADEKPLAEHASLFTAVSRIKSHQDPKLYATAPAVSSITDYNSRVIA